MNSLLFICIGFVIGYSFGLLLNKMGCAERDERIKDLENEINDLINNIR